MRCIVIDAEGIDTARWQEIDEPGLTSQVDCRACGAGSQQLSGKWSHAHARASIGRADRSCCVGRIVTEGVSRVHTAFASAVQCIRSRCLSFRALCCGLVCIRNLPVVRFRSHPAEFASTATPEADALFVVKKMDARPWAPGSPPRCLHSGESPCAQEPDEAAAAFRQCAAAHVLPAALEALHAAEIDLRALQARVEHAQGVEMSRRVTLQQRIHVVFGLVENARDALNAPLPAAASGAASVLARESEPLEPVARVVGLGSDSRVAEERVTIEKGGSNLRT